MAKTKIDLSMIPSPVRRIATIAVIVLIGMLIFSSACLVYVRPYEHGIKQVNIGINRGIQKKVYNTGLYFVMPFGMETMHKFPRDVQVMEMTQYTDTSAKSRKVFYDNAPKIQTSDGFYVIVDVSILYSIEDPYKVITTLGKNYHINGIVPKAEPILKETLGELTTEEFYNSPLRYEKTSLATSALNTDLKEKGLRVHYALVRYFVYSQEIQKNIEEKKLKDQLVFKNQAEARAAAEAANLKKVVEEGEATMKVKLEEGKAYETRRRAEMNLYVRKKQAEADLLIKLAEARRTELKNQALKGAGSAQLVGLRMAEALKGLDLVILPSDGKEGFNPLDLDRTLTFFDAKAGGAR